MTNKERALTLIDELKDRGAINNREMGTLRRAILLPDKLFGNSEQVKGDLISRATLKEKLQYVYSCEYIGSKSKEGIVSDIIDEIDKTPTVNDCPNCGADMRGGRE